MKDEVAMTFNISESSPTFSSSHLNAVTITFPPQVERCGIRACNTLTLKSLGSRTKEGWFPNISPLLFSVKSHFVNACISNALLIGKREIQS